jgi:hypothetical protein
MPLSKARSLTAQGIGAGSRRLVWWLRPFPGGCFQPHPQKCKMHMRRWLQLTFIVIVAINFSILVGTPLTLRI